MKFLAVFAVIALAGFACAEDTPKLTPEQMEKVHNIATECIKESQTTEEKAQALRKGDFSNIDDNTKCFAKCFQTKLGYVVNGVIQKEVVQKALGALIGEDNIKAIQEKCDDTKGTDECDTAFQLFKCYYTQKAVYL